MIQRKNKSYKAGNHHLMNFTYKYRVHAFIVLLCLFRFYHTGILYAAETGQDLIPQEIQSEAATVESSNEDTSSEEIWGGSEKEAIEKVQIAQDIPSDESVDIQEEDSQTTSNISSTEGGSYEVKEGDTLRGIAKEYYGVSAKYHIIKEANKDTIKDENHLDIGQILKIPEVQPEPPGLLEAPIENGTIIIISDSTVMRRKKWFWLSLQATFQLLSKDSTKGNFAIAIGCAKEMEPHIILPPYEPGESLVQELNKAKSIVGRLGLNSTVQDAFYILESIPRIVKETKFVAPNLVLMIGTEWSYGGHSYADDLDLSKEKLTDTINSLTIVHFSTSEDDINNDFYDGLNEYTKPLKKNARFEKLHFRYGKNKDKDQENKLVKRISKILLAKTHSKKKYGEKKKKR